MQVRAVLRERSGQREDLERTFHRLRVLPAGEAQSSYMQAPDAGDHEARITGTRFERASQVLVRTDA